MEKHIRFLYETDKKFGYRLRALIRANRKYSLREREHALEKYFDRMRIDIYECTPEMDPILRELTLYTFAESMGRVDWCEIREMIESDMYKQQMRGIEEC